MVYNKTTFDNRNPNHINHLHLESMLHVFVQGKEIRSQNQTPLPPLPRGGLAGRDGTQRDNCKELPECRCQLSQALLRAARWHLTGNRSNLGTWCHAKGTWTKRLPGQKPLSCRGSLLCAEAGKLPMVPQTGRGQLLLSLLGGFSHALSLWEARMHLLHEKI